ncbi:MAG: adenosine deaminase family protein [Corynebacterium sp.]|uniref:adenosine deaminase family protein n=1 Tax=Corynebacterium sp. TaxID=1720 RepID=UPI0026E01116|nr:adenosine deaminase family protein [Corynebacterium sp.]MDO5669861.1 adenosine deaminase family protein [Corynebacterium sp.]
MNDISALPTVLLHDALGGEPAQTPAELSTQVREHLKARQAQGVVYLELHVELAAHIAGGLTLQEVIDCVVAGLDVPLIDARLIPTTHTSGDVAAVASLVVSNHGRQVVGFGLVGDARPHLAALAQLRANYVPFTVAVTGLVETDAALQAGAVRLGHPLALIDDFSIDTTGFDGILPGRVSGWVRDRHLSCDFFPSAEVAAGTVDEYSEHPLTLLQQLGFTCTVHADDFERLEQVFGYGAEEFFDLTLNAVRGAFLTEVERQDLLERVILPAYESQDLQAGLEEFGDQE